MAKPQEDVPTLLHDALAIMEELGMEDTPEFGSLLESLGNQTRDIAKKREYHERSIAILEKLDHPSLVPATLDYARSFGITQDWEEARVHYEKVFELGERFDTPGMVLHAKHNYGHTYRQAGDCETALPYLEEALEGFSEKLSEMHEFTAGARFNVGDCLLTLGRPAEAIPYFEGIVNHRWVVYPEFHENKVPTLKRLALAHERSGHPDRALPYRQLLLGHAEHFHDVPHAEVADALWRLAKAELASRGTATAVPYFDRAIEVIAGIDGVEPYCPAGWEAAKHALIGNTREALRHLNRALELGLDPSMLADDEDLVDLAGNSEFEAMLAMYEPSTKGGRLCPVRNAKLVSPRLK